MKVLITTDWYKPVINGVVTSVINLAQGLRALGHEVKILTLSGTHRSYTQDDVTYIGSVGVGMIYPNARLRAVPAKKYVRRLIKWHPDIVHSQCEFSTFLLAKNISKACGCPLVHTYHTVYEDFTHYFYPSIRLGKHMAAKFSRRILSQAQAVIAPTEKTAHMLIGYGVKTPVHTVPSGLNLEQFCKRMQNAERSATRKSLGLADTDHVVVYLGRLAKEKNISELMKLFSMQDRPDLRFLLVGDGPYRSSLEREAKDLGIADRVIFAGMVPPCEATKYYQLGDIFVSASRSETQGLTYIEAMASGLPILCRADPCLEQVVQDGVNGFTYTCAKQFHQKLNLLLHDEAVRFRLGGAARKTAFENYSASLFASHVAEVYRDPFKNEAFTVPCSEELIGA